MLEKCALERARKYISTVRWIFAKTYAKTAPHEYTLRKDKPELGGEFMHLVNLIHTVGYDDTFWGKEYRYLDIDEHQYWTDDDTLEGTILINRAKKS